MSIRTTEAQRPQRVQGLALQFSVFSVSSVGFKTKEFS
jgi:hypothetical protein